MKICTWNVRRATKKREDVWKYFLEMDVDIALLQEVNSIPESVTSNYAILEKKAFGKNGKEQHFSTAVLVRGVVERELNLSSSWDWVNEEIKRFDGNLILAEITLTAGKSFRVISVYSPAWPVDRQRLEGIDVSDVKLKQNPDVWLTEILWAALLSENLKEHLWIVGGDLNSSVTFDTLWKNGDRGNQEIQNRMNRLGFIECLVYHQGQLTPTFKNATGGKVIHQMDHLYIPERIKQDLLSCKTGDADRIFDSSLSDHLPIIAEVK
jgi:exonuclease III